MSNPLAFLCQPSPKPVVPIRIAIVGPPKSGKTTCMNIFNFVLYVTYIDFHLLPPLRRLYFTSVCLFVYFT